MIRQSKTSVAAAIVVTAAVSAGGGAWAQAPAAGSGGGGPVGQSGSTPTASTGKTPPGTPSGATGPGRMSRDKVGQKVIGHTTTPPGPVPGNTGGQGTGTK